jgi:hypothetical protein
VSVKRALTEVRAPDEGGAEERAWTIVRSAYLDRTPSRSRPSSRWAIALALALLVAALALSPAGATVGRLITRALGVQHAASVLSALPGRGRLLVSGPAGTWTVAGDGSTRRLGPWRQASWSPHGRYVAVTAVDRLTVVDAHGNQLWSLRRPAVTDPRWYSPSGFRIAYLSNTALRVVAGDGTGDHPVAAGVANAAPAWRPDHPYELAYVTNRGRVVVRDGDTGALIWSTAPGLHARGLTWSDDGEHLLALSSTVGRVYDGSGRLASTIALPRRVAATDGALSPTGSTVALVLGGNEVVVASAGSPRPALRRVLAGSGLREVAFSPDGRWLLVSWPAADQWVFVRAVGAPGIAAVSRISEQFSTPGLPHGFPQLDGWCCTAGRSAG